MPTYLFLTQAVQYQYYFDPKKLLWIFWISYCLFEKGLLNSSVKFHVWTWLILERPINRLYSKKSNSRVDYQNSIHLKIVISCLKNALKTYISNTNKIPWCKLLYKIYYYYYYCIIGFCNIFFRLVVHLFYHGAFEIQ